METAIINFKLSLDYSIESFIIKQVKVFWKFFKIILRMFTYIFDAARPMWNFKNKKFRNRGIDLEKYNNFGGVV